VSANSSKTESERQDTQNDRTDVIQLKPAGGSSHVADATSVRHVFISHKGRDAPAAEAIRKALKMRGPKSLEIFVSERIKAGLEWSPEIWKNLRRADWLLLLYTDPSQEWDWCLFEAGFFAGQSREGDTRLVCLHTTDAPPPMPVRHWQSVAVTEAQKMENFLVDFFSGINDELVGSPEEQQKLADEIAEAFKLKVKRLMKSECVNDFIILSLDPSQVAELEKTDSIPDAAKAGLDPGESLRIFGRGIGEWTWKDLQAGLQEKFKGWWTSSLGNALRTASLQMRPLPVIPDLFSPQLKKEYHVTLLGVEHFSDGSKNFRLFFYEKFPETEVGRTSELRLIGDMLRMGRTFRWKIVDKYHRDISIMKAANSDSSKIEQCLHELNSWLDWLVGESMRLDILIKEDVLKAFENEDDIKELDHILSDLWPRLFTSLKNGIDTKNLDEVLNALNGMRCMNKKFMVLSARRYEQLLEKLPEPSFSMPSDNNLPD
jgi:hypothetical protein